MVLREAKRLERARLAGLCSENGDQAASRLLRSEPLERYTAMPAASKHLTLRADLVEEPGHSQVVHMLEALPEGEGAFYALEENVVDNTGKSHELFLELEDHFGVVGGSYTEYCKC